VPQFPSALMQIAAHRLQASFDPSLLLSPAPLSRKQGLFRCLFVRLSVYSACRLFFFIMQRGVRREGGGFSYRLRVLLMTVSDISTRLLNDFPDFDHSTVICVAVWLSGNALASINVVALRQTRLVPGWVTVCMWTGCSSASLYVTSQLGQLSLSSFRGR